MKKMHSIFLSFAALTLLLTGCGNSVANEKKIQEDLTSYADFLNADEKITNVEIENRQTEKDAKTDTIWCSITTEDEECSYQKDVVLIYGVHDDGGWLLDDVAISSKKEWVIAPLTGIKEENVPTSLKNESIVIDGEHWEITPRDISFSQHHTDLKSKTDTITAHITIEDDVQEATGELTLVYTFDNAWKIKTISGEETFTVSTIEGRELDVSEENLSEVLAGEEYQYGIPENTSVYFTSDLQTVTISKNDVSNLVIDNIEIKSKGTIQTYTCHCTLTKPNAEFAINATLTYRYSGADGWTIQPRTVALKCTSVAMLGDWNGTYNSVGDKGKAVLSITDVSEDGTISGVYSYTPNNITQYSHAGSYYVSGKIDFATMLIKLDAGEWVNEPSKYLSIEKADIIARLYVDDSQISGKGHHGYTFNLARSN